MHFTPKTYTVKEITNAIKNSLEEEFPQVEVEGEISNAKLAASGHFYFSLKDADSVLTTVMFRGAMSKVPFRPKDGDKVKARGRITVYPARGNYQLLCSSMVLAGEGDILAKLEERKRRLASEGLFSSERKKPLPPYPKSILILTSATGAAVKDILRVIRRRGYKAAIRILPIPVQGAEAAARIAAMLHYANEKQLGDVIILGRGGGSLEDLLPFSEEIVVRSVADSEIPVISAVGHEIDYALTDFAADLRAATPTAAGEMVCPLASEIQTQILLAKESMITQMQRRFQTIRASLQSFSTGYKAETLFYLTQPKRQKLDDSKETLLLNMQDRLITLRRRYEDSIRDIHNLSPRSILARGFAVVNHQGRTLKSTEGLLPGQGIAVILSRGSFDAEVREVHQEEGKKNS
jgi:exodeoxyribonuclease VII large subunit